MIFKLINYCCFLFLRFHGLGTALTKINSEIMTHFNILQPLQCIYLKRKNTIEICKHRTMIQVGFRTVISVFEWSKTMHVLGFIAMVICFIQLIANYIFFQYCYLRGRQCNESSQITVATGVGKNQMGWRLHQLVSSDENPSPYHWSILGS